MRATLGALVFLLLGCAHVEVVDMGHGRHSLTASAPSGGHYGSREEAVERANEFCRRSGQAAVADGFYDKPETGPQGEHTSTILFRCAAPTTLQF